GAQGLAQRRGIRELARLHAPAQRLHHAGGGGNAHVGGDQRGLDLVEEVVVQARIARKQAAQAAGDAAAHEPLAPAAATGGGGRLLDGGPGERAVGRRRGG